MRGGTRGDKIRWRSYGFDVVNFGKHSGFPLLHAFGDSLEFGKGRVKFRD